MLISGTNRWREGLIHLSSNNWSTSNLSLKSRLTSLKSLQVFVIYGYMLHYITVLCAFITFKNKPLAILWFKKSPLIPKHDLLWTACIGSRDELAVVVVFKNFKTSDSEILKCSHTITCAVFGIRTCRVVMSRKTKRPHNVTNLHPSILQQITQNCERKPPRWSFFGNRL